MNTEWMMSLLGGVVIGVAVSLMLYLNGRVTGISGILNGALAPQKEDTLWRILFVLGLVVGGFVLMYFRPSAFLDASETALYQVTLAGLLVGFGTVMGSGCTSGHGVCGVSRWSMRSLVATGTFIGAGIFSVWLARTLLGGLL